MNNKMTGCNNFAGMSGEQVSCGKQVFIEPKLRFIEPRLTKQGDATKITAGFFGTFAP